MTDNSNRFRDRYACSGHEALLAAEREALGTDYQASGYTTIAEATEIGRQLELRPGQILVDIGAGCGWPGLYLAATHGCAVISIDPVVQGGQVAAARIVSDDLGGRAWPVCANGEALPVRSGSVDAIVHVDMLC